MTATLVVLDENVAYGFRAVVGGYNTTHIKGGGGYEYSNQNWSTGLGRWEFAFGDKDQSDIRTVIAFHHSRRGSLERWLLKDHLNFQLTNELILTAVGGETTAQIKQTLGSDNPISYDRKYIKSGTLVVKRNGVAMTLTTHYTVNSTGLITAVSPASWSASDTITVTAEFYYKVRFESDTLNAGIDFFDTANIGGIVAVECR
jgi:uncharacterized protein (TIGR02217 family)